MNRKPLFLMILMLFLMSIPSVALEVQTVGASGTIYIRADGSIDPPTAPISTIDYVTYTFTGNISDSIMVERDNIVCDGEGYTVQGTFADDSKGIDLTGKSNTSIKDMNIRAFYYGIYLYSSSNNNVSGNNITNNNNGIVLELSHGNVVSGNNIANDGCGIWLIDPLIIRLHMSSGNAIFGNNIDNNNRSIALYSSSDNTISENNITNNSIGIGLDGAPGNGIYHNNFIDNTQQLYGGSPMIIWDNGYPSGGNYWSDYSGVDEKSGSSQDHVGSDGIGDTPYVIDSNNRDRYPLMYPWKVTLETDVNADGVVNIVDVTLVAKAFASRPGDHNWDERADIDNNGVVNVIDLGRVCKDFGKKAHTLSARKHADADYVFLPIMLT